MRERELLGSPGFSPLLVEGRYMEKHSPIFIDLLIRFI